MWAGGQLLASQLKHPASAPWRSMETPGGGVKLPWDRGSTPGTVISNSASCRMIREIAPSVQVSGDQPARVLSPDAKSVISGAVPVKPSRYISLNVHCQPCGFPYWPPNDQLRVVLRPTGGFPTQGFQPPPGRMFDVGSNISCPAGTAANRRLGRNYF